MGLSGQGTPARLTAAVGAAMMIGALALGSGARDVVAAPRGAAVIFSASGANPAAIQTTVDSFRTALGTNNGVGGTFPSGRREINWDGVPDAFAAPNNLPGNFFNVNSPRGVTFSTAGTGFQVSANAASGTPVLFGNINATYPTRFQTFSPQRLFSPIGSTATDVLFFEPGTTNPATTTAFGAVFVDVSDSRSSRLTFFDVNNNSLASQNVTNSALGLTFLGIQFNAGERAVRVRIDSGDVPLGPNEALPGGDIVVLDDFIYAEPQPILGPPPVLTATSTSTSTSTSTATTTATATATSTATGTAVATSTATATTVVAATTTPTPVIPEPPVYLLFASGLLLLGFAAWRRRR